MATTFHQPMFGMSAGEVRAKWGWFVALGVGLLVFGGVAFAHLFVATVATVYYVGALMLIGGIAEIVHAFGVKTWGRFFFWLASGIIYALAGFFAFYNPLLASSVLTLLLAVSLIVAGVIRMWVGYEAKPAQGWGWIVATGLLTLLTGLVIAAGWPVNSLWVLGLLLAIDLIFQGWGFIAFGLGLKATH